MVIYTSKSHELSKLILKKLSKSHGHIYFKSLHKSKKCSFSLFLKILNFSNYIWSIKQSMKTIKKERMKLQTFGALG